MKKNPNYIQLKSKTDMSGFYIAYYGSTINETNFGYKKGISHLMEHLITHKFRDLLNEFDRYGIDWNAYTDNNIIVFHMTGLNEYIMKYKKIFYDRIKTFNITQKILDNEKKIVLEEYKDSFNIQSASHIMNLYRKRYNYYSAIGDRKDIESVTLKDCKDYWNFQFKQPGRIIDVCKNNSKEMINYFSNEVQYNFIDYPIIKNDVLYPTDNIEILNEFKEKSSIIFQSPIITKDFIYVMFIKYMLSMGLQSPLYDEVREKLGLVYYVSMYPMVLGYDKVQMNIQTETSNENVNNVIGKVKYVLKNFKKFMTRERFDVILECLNIEKQKNKIREYAIGDLYTSPHKFDIYKYLTVINYNDVIRVYNEYFNIDKSNWYISVDKEEFKNEDI